MKFILTDYDQEFLKDIIGKGTCSHLNCDDCVIGHYLCSDDFHEVKVARYILDNESKSLRSLKKPL